MVVDNEEALHRKHYIERWLLVSTL
jgi:hypothetical protein